MDKVGFVIIIITLLLGLRIINKAGYTANLVACGLAGAVLEKVTRAQKAQKRQKSKKRTDRPSDQPTDQRTDT